MSTRLRAQEVLALVGKRKGWGIEGFTNMCFPSMPPARKRRRITLEVPRSWSGMLTRERNVEEDGGSSRRGFPPPKGSPSPGGTTVLGG